MGPAIRTAKNRTGEHLMPQDEEPGQLRQEKHDRIQPMVGSGHNVLGLLSRNGGPTENSMGGNPPNGDDARLASPPLSIPAR